jgi:cytidylate kinase
MSEEVSYILRAEGMQRRADEAMLAWLDGLSREERDSVLLSPAYAKVAEVWHGLPVTEKLRLAQGDGGGHGDVGLDGDVADSAAASYSVDFAGAMDTFADELQEELGLDRQTAEAVAAWDEERRVEAAASYKGWLLPKVLMRLTNALNARIASVALAFALSVPEVWLVAHMEGRTRRVRCRTQIEAARALKTTRQNLSKEVRRAAVFLGITEGLHLKRSGAVESFRKAQSAGRVDVGYGRWVGAHWRGKIWRRVA